MFNILNILEIAVRLQELGFEIRRARQARALTQAKLATAAGLSRTTLNLLENGVFPDLGVKKLSAILDQVGLLLTVHQAPKAAPQDFIRMACTTASVSYRHPLTEDQLIRALLDGKIPAGRKPHMRTLFDEATPALLKGLVAEVSRWTKPGRVEKNLARISRGIGSTRKFTEWLKTA
jgi:DNA-binding XRE family transcriptional regulator